VFLPPMIGCDALKIRGHSKKNEARSVPLTNAFGDSLLSSKHVFAPGLLAVPMHIAQEPKKQKVRAYEHTASNFKFQQQ